MKVLFRAMLVNASHTTLEDREKALNSISMDRGIVSINVFVGRMPNGAVSRKDWSNIIVVAGIVGDKFGFPCDILFEDRHNGRSL